LNNVYIVITGILTGIPTSKIRWNETHVTYLYSYELVRNDMDIIEHERLSNITLGHKLK